MPLALCKPKNCDLSHIIFKFYLYFFTYNFQYFFLFHVSKRRKCVNVNPSIYALDAPLSISSDIICCMKNVSFASPRWNLTTEFLINRYSYFVLKREKIPFAAILSGFSAIISLLKVYAFSSDNNFSGIVLKNSKYSLTSTTGFNSNSLQA